MCFLLNLFIYFIFFLSLKLECLFGLSSVIRGMSSTPHRSAKRDQKAFSESRGATQTEVNPTDSAETVDFRQGEEKNTHTHTLGKNAEPTGVWTVSK